MGIGVSFDAEGVTDPEQRATLAASGSLDGEEVWFEFLTQEDGAVRPSHAALDHTCWKVGDPNAPVPPLDYGCRCFIRYVSKPGSMASRFLPKAPSPLTTTAEAYEEYLTRKLPKWAAIAEKVAKLPVLERAGRAMALVQEANASLSMADARGLASMLLQVFARG